MVTWFTIIISLVIVQRSVELLIAKRNAKYAQAMGGYEIGRDHYPLLVFLHFFFL